MTTAIRIPLLAAMAVLAGLAAMTLAVSGGHATAFDRTWLDAFATLRGPAPDAFFLAVTWLGSSYVLMPATLLLMAALVFQRFWASALLLGLTYFGATLTTWLLKMTIGRERPALHAVLGTLPSDAAYPSGHATHAAAFALALWLLAGRHAPHRRAAAGAALGTLVLLVAASRLYLQVHWPSDVLAGLLVAAFWAALVRAGTHQHWTTGATT